MSEWSGNSDVVRTILGEEGWRGPWPLLLATLSPKPTLSKSWRKLGELVLQIMMIEHPFCLQHA